MPRSISPRPRSRPTPNRKLASPRHSAAESLEPRRLLASTVAFGAARYDVDESAGSASFTIVRGGDTAGTVDVTFKMFGGQFFLDTATPGEDFTDVSGAVTFADGETLKTVVVPVNDDALPEGNEHIIVNFTAADAAAVAPSDTKIYIHDDDSPGVLELSAATYSVNEATGALTVTVNRGGTLAGTVGVPYRTTSGSSLEENGRYTAGLARPGYDFTDVAGTLTFADGQTSATFDVPILQDATGEPDEQFRVTLGEPTGGATLASLSAASARVSITDDDGGAAANRLPVAANDAATATSGEPVTIDVRANDADPEGEPLEVRIPNGFTGDDTPNGPDHGRLSYADNGTPADWTDDRLVYRSFVGFVGTDTFRYLVRDAAGAEGFGTVTVRVGGGMTSDPLDPATPVLVVGGGDGPDLITLARAGRDHVAASVNGQTQGTVALAGSVVMIVGGSGNDRVRVGRGVRTSLRVDGGVGDDILMGTPGNDILIGGDGDDRISGSAGRDILIGGEGADRLGGGGGDDILIAGATLFDTQPEGRRLVMDTFQDAWSAATDYATRAAAVTAPPDGPILSPSTLTTDAATDVLTGQAGTDLYFADRTGAAAPDVLPGRRSGETVLEL
jgi:hypothetical protein